MGNEERDSFAAIEAWTDDHDEYVDYLKRAYPTYVLDRNYHSKTRRGKEIEGLLGEGGFARVYACRDRNFHNEPRAVKIIKWSRDYPTEKIKEEFDLQYEFRDVSVRPDPYPVINDRKFFGVSMEMMNGTLKDLLKKNKNRFDAVDTVRIMKEISFLVARLHNNEPSVAHFDIKPENIFYKMENGKRIFKLGDYGCAKNTDATISRPAGTDKYCLNFHEPGQPRDVYALGIIMMELQGAEITVHNFNERFHPETMWEHTEAPVDTDLRAISRKACSTSLEDRYTINSFIEALDMWLEEHKDEVSMKDDSAEILLRKAKAFELGVLGTPLELNRAAKYYKAAEKKKSGEAAYRLYKIFDHDAETYSKEKVMEQLENSMDLNYAPAMNEYACRKIKEMGVDGDSKELMKMAELLRQAAPTLPAAAYNLALLMKAGVIAEESENEADKLLMLAVNHNYEAAVRLHDALDQM